MFEGRLCTLPLVVGRSKTMYHGVIRRIMCPTLSILTIISAGYR